MLFIGGALVSARLCRLPEQEVHQQSKYAPTQPHTLHGLEPSKQQQSVAGLPFMQMYA